MNINHLNLRVRDPAGCRDFYQRHFGFRPTYEAEGGYFMRNGYGFLLALTPPIEHQPLPEGFHLGFSLEAPEAVNGLAQELSTAGVRTSPLQDFRPGEEYVTFRCWDPDGTELEVFWEAP